MPSATLDGATPHASPPWWRNQQLWLAVGIAVAVRLVLALAWPPQCFSCDLKAWRLVAASTLVGVNPYAATQLVNWPPLWMEVLYGLGKISVRFDWDFFTCMRVFLTACDAVLVFSTFALLYLLNERRLAFRLVLLGLCLNPMLILLTVQQGNFDVVPTIGIVWFVYSLIRFRRGGNAVDWLVAAAWLGLATFAKTFPLVLIPLLAGESRRVGWKVRLTGAALCVGPALLSLAPLYVLNPQRITDVVLLYRGTPGPVGASGLLQLVCGYDSVLRYAPFFTVALLGAMIGLTAVLWRAPLRRDSDVALLAATVLIAVFEFGSGYCPQYWLWVAPLLIAAYAHQPPGLRRLLCVAAVLIVLTNVLTFAYENILGSFMLWWAPNFPGNARLRDLFSDTEHNLVLLSLPMTGITLLLWLHGCRSIAAERAKASQ